MTAAERAEVTLWLVLPLLVASAAAYETDQLTWRERQLVDATDTADALLAPLLAEAVAATNERTGCAGTDDEVRQVLAHQIREATSRRRPMPSRGLLRAPGFSVYTAALEGSDADRFAFDHREDLYGGLSAWQSVVLATAGTCSTFEIAGVRIGSDKLDHFLDTGFHYFQAARARGEERALSRGTAQERSIYGLLTSKAFSWADLAANYDGWRFYAGLLGPGSPFARDERGCVAQIGRFTWRDHVRIDWDEVENPPVYTRLVEDGVLRRLQRDRDVVCASVARWDPAGERAARIAHLQAHPPYVVGPAPARRDPWQLAALCDPDRVAPLVPWPVPPGKEARRLYR